jgi:predicted membrane metal-binding protein
VKAARNGARQVAVATRRRRRRAKAQRDYDIVQLREWAGSNGIEVPARGRIRQTVVDQCKAAGGRWLSLSARARARAW